MSIRTDAAGRSRRSKLAALWLTALMLSAAAGSAHAEPQGDGRDWNRGGDTLTGAVGLHCGKIGGTGLSFRLPLQWFLYAQVAGGIWHTGDNQRHNLGLQLHYLLRQDSHLRLFTGVGVANYYHREKTGTSPAGDIFDKEAGWNYGAGVGIEVLQGPRWSWLAELDFVHEDLTGNTTVLPQAGLSYYW